MSKIDIQECNICFCLIKNFDKHLKLHCKCVPLFYDDSFTGRYSNADCPVHKGDETI